MKLESIKIAADLLKQLEINEKMTKDVQITDMLILQHDGKSAFISYTDDIRYGKFFKDTKQNVLEYLKAEKEELLKKIEHLS